MRAHRVPKRDQPQPPPSDSDSDFENQNPHHADIDLPGLGENLPDLPIRGVKVDHHALLNGNRKMTEYFFFILNLNFYRPSLQFKWQLFT
jgi:hypothetical protein